MLVIHSRWELYKHVKDRWINKYINTEGGKITALWLQRLLVLKDT